MDVSLSELLGAAPNPNDVIQRNLMAYMADQRAQQDQQLQQQQGQQALAINAFKLQQAQDAQQAQQAQQLAYQNAVGAFMAQPTAEGAANLQLQFPDQAKAIQESWKTRDEAVQTADRRDLATVYSALNAGRTDLAQKLLEERQAAEEKAGKQEPMVGVLLDALKSDPAKAKGIAAYVLSSIPGGEDFARTLSAIDKGQGQNHVINEGGALVDNAGNVLYQAGKSAKYEKIRNADGTESIVEIPQSGPVGRSAAPSVGMSGAQMEQTALAAVPGATVTSRARTPQHNAEVGGKPNSYHLTDQARDFVPPVGMTIPQMAARLKAAMPDAKVIAEKDHAHVQPMSRSQVGVGRSAQVVGGARVVATSQGAGQGESAPGDTTKTGEEYLATLPPSMAAQVKQLSEGRLAMPTGAALRSPKVAQLMAAAAQYDPTLDQVDAATRRKTRLEFTSGKAAQNITSFNTVLHHIDTLEHAANDLNNGSIPAWNWVANKAASAGGDPRVAKFNSAKQAVVDELERAFRGSSGTLAGIQGWEENLNAAQSPAQIKGVLKQMASLLSGRIEALGEQYTAGMGRATQGINLLDSKAKATLDRLENGGRSSGQSGGVVRVTSPAQAQALPSGTRFMTPDGRVMVKR